VISKTEGIIIGDKDYGESSKIIFILTKEYGLISAIAKGVKRLKSKLRGVSDKLTFGYFHLYYHEHKLSTLIEVDIIDHLKVIKEDITKISYLSYLGDLVSQVLRQVNKDACKIDIYEAFKASMLKINNHFDPLVITNILELKLLSYLGVKPNLDSCVNCGDNKKIATISVDRGGFICSKCLKGEPIISSKALKLIRLYYYVDIAKITKLKIKDEVKKEINQFINQYYEKYTGLYLKGKQFAESIGVI